MKIIIGLGNPGKTYENTRHNIGFNIIDILQKEWGFEEWKDSKFKGVIASGGLSNGGGNSIILLKPTTFMNLSGESTESIVHFYKLDPSCDILVISDDLDMEFGKVRFREKGSHGGQNGIRNIIERLGTDVFSRIKIGIGRDERYAVIDWVLSKFRKEELDAITHDVFPLVETRIRNWIIGKKD